MKIILVLWTLINFAESLDNGKKQFCVQSIQNSVVDSCEVQASLLTPDEQKTLLMTLCGETGPSDRNHFKIFQIRNGKRETLKTFKYICDDSTLNNHLLAWMSSQKIFELAEKNQRGDLKEEISCIPKSTMSHLCLVEILPLMYEIRNITYQQWANITNSYKEVLGQTMLQNESNEKKITYGSIDYAYIEKIKVNVEVTSDQLQLKILPILLEYRGNVVTLDKNGIGEVERKERSYFGLNLGAGSATKVHLIGQWAQRKTDFSATIYERFDNNFSRLKGFLPICEIIFTQITSTEPVYENHENSQLPFADNEVKSSNHPYPGFFPYFIAGSIVVGLALLLTLCGMIRTLFNEKKTVKFNSI